MLDRNDNPCATECGQYIIPGKIIHLTPADYAGKEEVRLERLVAGQGMEERFDAHIIQLAHTLNRDFNRNDLIPLARWIEGQKKLRATKENPNPAIFDIKDYTKLANGEGIELFKSEDKEGMPITMSHLPALMVLAQTLAIRSGTLGSMFTIIAGASSYLRNNKHGWAGVVAVDSSQARYLPHFKAALFDTTSYLAPGLTLKLLYPKEGDKDISIPLRGAFRSVVDLFGSYLKDFPDPLLSH